MNISASWSLFFGVFTVLIGYWYNQRLERKNRIYSERREVYSKFIRSWWAIMHYETLTEELNLEYSHAKSLFAMHATPKAIAAFNKITKFIVKNNYLNGEYDEGEYLKIIGEFLVRLRKDSGGKPTEPESILGLSYISVPDLEANGVIDKW